MRSILVSCVVYGRSCGILFALSWLFIAASVQAASLPPIHNGGASPPRLPTKVLNCSLPGLTINGISPSLGGFSNCVRGKVHSYATSSVTEATSGLQQQLGELQQSLEGMVPGNVQQYLNTAGNALSTSVNAARNNPTQFAQRHLNDVFSGLQDRAGTVLNITLDPSQSPAARMAHFEQMLLGMINADPLDIPCSTPSVPGGAVCGVVWSAANIVMDTALWGLGQGANKALDVVYDGFLDEYHARLRAQGTTRQQLARHPQFGRLVALMPSSSASRATTKRGR